MKTKSFVIALLLAATFLPRLSAQTCTPIEVKQVDAQKALVMKADIPMTEISTKIGEMYKAVFTYIMENNIQPAGPSFAVYYSWEPEGNIVFEAGVPVSGEVEGTDDIILREFPEMKAVSTLYKGSYEDIGPTYEKLSQYLKDEELTSDGSSWEVYLTDPSLVTDPAMNQTLIYFPIE
ncbi:MAG: GyrI-like domain-containing protein [Bacteroidales bacterium]|nr:GyrI-like domain-containing protein [Bacteroidales bacterium]